MIKHLVIERERWSRNGAYGDLKGEAFTNALECNDGKMCCLGFLSGLTGARCARGRRPRSPASEQENRKMSDILDKIRKLRALATSSNVHEAAAAAAAAERLVQEYNINEAELPIPQDLPSVEDDPIVVWGFCFPIWETWLVSFLTKHYNCAGCIYIGETDRSFKIAGARADVELVRYQWAYFRTEILRLYSSWPTKGRAARNSFCLGAVDAIVTALKESKQEVHAQASSTALATLDSRAQAARHALSDRYNLRTTR